MDVAEWILVAILSVTLFVFLVIGIVLMIKILGISKEVKKVVAKSQDIADNANEVVTNVKGMTAFGQTMELIVDKVITPKVKAKLKQDEEKKKAEKK